MNNSPYVPCGFTQGEVAWASQQLPEPYARACEAPAGCRRYRVAVHDHDAMFYDCGGYSRPCDSVRMRVLEFELNSALDYRTDRIIYWWTLVGGS